MGHNLSVVGGMGAGDGVVYCGGVAVFDRLVGVLVGGSYGQEGGKSNESLWNKERVRMG